MARVFTITLGLLFCAIGLFGTFYPDIVAEYYGWEFSSIDAKTQLRVFIGSLSGIGFLMIYFSLKMLDQRPVLLAVGILNLSYILPRMIGLLTESFNQPVIISELIFEIVVLLMAGFFYQIESKKQKALISE